MTFLEQISRCAPGSANAAIPITSRCAAGGANATIPVHPSHAAPVMDSSNAPLGTSSDPLPLGLRAHFVRSTDPTLRHAAAAAPSDATDDTTWTGPAPPAPEDATSDFSIFRRAAYVVFWSKSTVCLWDEEDARSSAEMAAAWEALPVPPPCTAPDVYAAHLASRKRPAAHPARATSRKRPMETEWEAEWAALRVPSPCTAPNVYARTSHAPPRANTRSPLITAPLGPLGTARAQYLSGSPVPLGQDTARVSSTVIAPLHRLN